MKDSRQYGCGGVPQTFAQAKALAYKIKAAKKTPELWNIPTSQFLSLANIPRRCYRLSGDVVLYDSVREMAMDHGYKPSKVIDCLNNGCSMEGSGVRFETVLAIDDTIIKVIPYSDSTQPYK